MISTNADNDLQIFLYLADTITKYGCSICQTVITYQQKVKNIAGGQKASEEIYKLQEYQFTIIIVGMIIVLVVNFVTDICTVVIIRLFGRTTCPNA